jgi:hypothetical protein
LPSAWLELGARFRPPPAIIQRAEPWELDLHRKLAPLWGPPKPAIIRASKIEQAPLPIGAMLPGMVPVIVSKIPVLTFRGSQADTVDRTTYTFATKDIGTASADRIVAAAVMVQDHAAPTSVTLGGITATKLTDAATNGTIWWAIVPTGTTADLVFTMPGTAACCIIGWWTVNGPRQRHALRRN